MRILVVEDNEIIGSGLLIALELEGYAVDWVQNKETSTLAYKNHEYDLILLDIGLPDGSGFDLLKEIRSAQNTTPILIITAYDKTSFKVKGLDAGADDYLIKPFKLDELNARIRALHRRREGRAFPKLKVGDVELDPYTKRVTLNGAPIILGPKEFAILQLLMERCEEILSKETIEDNLYGWGAEIESNTIEVHISKLRKKLGWKSIKTVKNMGYCFVKRY